MANLPNNTDMTGASVTQGQFRAKLNDLLDYLRDILGTTGTPASARAALGLGTMATKNDVAAADLVTGAVTTAKLADGAVTTAKIGDGQVSSAKLANGAVTTAKIGDGQVASAKLADGAVTTAKIGDGQVTAAKLASGVMPLTIVGQANISSAVAQIDIAIPSSGNMFVLAITQMTLSTSAVVYMRTSTDGATFHSGNSDYSQGGAITLTSYGATAANISTPLDAWLLINPGVAGAQEFRVHGTVFAAGINGPVISPMSGSRTAVGRQAAILLFPSSGTITRATVRLLAMA